MIANLPMYDWPELADAHDAFWLLIRDNLRAAGHAAPDHLTRKADIWSEWSSPELLLGQTCGLPYREGLCQKVQLVGTLDYALPDTPAGFYFSNLIIRKDVTGSLSDFQDATLAINSFDSQSGWAAAQNHARENDFEFTKVTVTGAHANSAEAVADAQADIAAIDAVTWRLISRYKPDVANELQVLTKTAASPGLPLITARHRSHGAIATAVQAAVLGLAKDHKDALGIVGLVAIPEAAYHSIKTPKLPA